jgi:hypothetical protein
VLFEQSGKTPLDVASSSLVKKRLIAERRNLEKARLNLRNAASADDDV